MQQRPNSGKNRYSDQRCSQFNRSFKDIRQEVLAKPSNKQHREKYDHGGLVQLNDYTKNISNTVFSPGDAKVAKKSK